MKTQTRLLFLQSIIALGMTLGSLKASAQTEPFSKRTIVSGLNHAWEIVYGPNDSLWYTEDKAYKVTRISLGATPVKKQLIDLTSGTGGTGEKTFTGTPDPQGGLMGIAIHPNLYSSDPVIRAAKPWVYLAFVYSRTSGSCPNPGPACYFNTKIVRYEYKNDSLRNPVVIVNNMPGSSDHNSGRLVIGPTIETVPGGGTHSQYMLYYTIGDMGAGQLTNTTRINYAQNQNVMEGKVLRINTEPDGDGGQDAWVPNDNFFYDNASISPEDYVFSMGHRNPQGLTWGFVGGSYHLYSSEQSDKADDEVNLITKGSNYGWDMVSGKCDGDVNGFQIGGTTVVNEITNCAGKVEPIFTTFHTNATWSTYPTNTTNSTWPTMAASSIAFYGSNTIPGWKGSLLITPLKENRVYRLKLDATGTAISGDTISYFRGDGNRVRRIIVDPTGYKLYVARDAGTITEYNYTGVTLPLRLLSFTGEMQNNSALLQWETAEETNTASFEIERSADGAGFDRIGAVNAAGNSSTSFRYSYKDNEAGNQTGNTVFYRLKMIDIDGQYRYSNVVSISIAGIAGRVALVPNPVNAITKLSVTAVSNGNAQWKIADNAGRMVLQGSLQLMPGVNTTSINLNKLTPGLYYLSISGNGIQRKMKFQKL